MKKLTENIAKHTTTRNGIKIGFEFEFFSKLPFFKLVETFNNEYYPIRVHHFNKYHSGFKPDTHNFKLEPDSSGGDRMVEFITGPLYYSDARLMLIKTLAFIDKYGWTNERCAIQINISFDKEKTGFDLHKLNILKLILKTDEISIYKMFPERQGSVYARSVKELIPFKGFGYTSAALNLLVNYFDIPASRYYGVNLSHYPERIEYRYLGGKDYQLKASEILKCMESWIDDMWLCATEGLDVDDYTTLRNYLDTNINTYKNFSDFTWFSGEYPTIKVNIDVNDTFETVNTYWPVIYNKVYDLVYACEGISDCIINFDTATSKLEVANLVGKLKAPLDNMDFIECELIEGYLIGCELIECKVYKSTLKDCKIYSSVVSESRLTECNLDYNSTLDNCYYSTGLMDGTMVGGILRSGKIGRNAQISNTTKILSDSDSFFAGYVEGGKKDEKN